MATRFTLYAKTLLFLALLLFLVSYLFQNLLPALTGTLILVFLIYTKFSFQSTPNDYTMKRTIHEPLHYVNHTTNITTTITNHASPSLLTITDQLPPQTNLTTGTNTLSKLFNQGETHEITYQLTFTARGTHHFTSITLTTTDLWGLFITNHTIDVPTTIMIHSDPNEIKKATRVTTREHIELTIPSLVGTDLHSDMEGIRDYLPGDLLRDIEWKASAKLQKLMTKLYEKHETIDTTILVDCSRTMRRSSTEHSKLEHATVLALHLTKILQALRHNVSLISYDEHKVLTSIKPTHHYTPIYHALTDLPSIIPSPNTIPFTTTEPLLLSREAPEQQTFLQTIFPFLAKGNRTIRHPTQATGIYEALRILLLDNKTKHVIILTDMETTQQALYNCLNLAHARKYRLWLLLFFTPYYNTSETQLTAEQLEHLYILKKRRDEFIIKLKRQHIDIVELAPQTEGGKILETIKRTNP
ncbi:MAG: DUF58 domain-containing protein [Candidatus Thermoplasmatota archaeon]|nr:DUF58 domain-containing protein [Candidatus Thermoplasmatota archaeon]